MTKKDYNLIRSEYNKKLLAEHKANFSTLDNGLSYFIMYLRFLRDHYIINGGSTENQESTDLKVATLVAAVSEYDKYKTCIMNYYKLNGGVVERLTDESEEEVAKKYNSERSFHWRNFWQLVMTNIEGWTTND